MGRSDVEAGEKRWLEAFNAGDAGGVAAQYESEARIAAPEVDTIVGRAAIEGFVKEFTAARATLSFRLVDVYGSDDLSVAVGEYDLVLQPEGVEPQQDRGKFVEVWRRQPDGTWLIADDIFNSSLPAALPPA
jgi:ketosteroid isomerase-like protein